MCCENTVIQALHERGMRLTPQREMVLHVLHEIETDATAEEIFTRVSQLSPAVDLSTVYRTLDLFTSLDVVSSFSQVDGSRRYELITMHAPHFHLLCRICGRMISASLKELSPLQEQLRQTHQFDAQLEHLVIPGICAECSAHVRSKNSRLTE